MLVLLLGLSKVILFLSTVYILRSLFWNNICTVLYHYNVKQAGLIVIKSKAFGNYKFCLPLQGLFFKFLFKFLYTYIFVLHVSEFVMTIPLD